jgi:hypothetical protein
MVSAAAEARDAFMARIRAMQQLLVRGKRASVGVENRVIKNKRPKGTMNENAAVVARKLVVRSGLLPPLRQGESDDQADRSKQRVRHDG